MKYDSHHMFGHTLLRVTIGLLFFIMGVKKITNPEGIIGMLSNIGFPAALFFGWVLILSEIIFGALIFIGYKVRYTSWPLAIILFIASVTVTLPNDGITSPGFFFHLIGISGLVTIALTGPGKWAISISR